MDNQKFTTLKERLLQIKQGGKYRSINNRRLKKLALRKKTTGKLTPCELRDKVVRVNEKRCGKGEVCYRK